MRERPNSWALFVLSFHRGTFPSIDSPHLLCQTHVYLAEELPYEVYTTSDFHDGLGRYRCGSAGALPILFRKTYR